MSALKDNIAFLLAHHPELESWISAGPSLSELEAFASKTGHPLENLMLYNLAADNLKWRNIRFIFLDVDGVLTEGGMFYTESGDEFKRFDTKDGMAIKTAMKHGFEFGIISSGINQKIIEHRADMFGIRHVYVGTAPKLEIAEKWMQKLSIDWSETAYIGDDINDLQMFEKVGISACPSDAVNPIKSAADFVLEAKGGRGCIREFMRYLPSLKPVL